MTTRKTQFTERQFREAFLRWHRDLALGRVTLDRFAHWLDQITVSGAPLDHERKNILLGAVKLLAFGMRKETQHAEAKGR